MTSNGFSHAFKRVHGQFICSMLCASLSPFKYIQFYVHSKSSEYLEAISLKLRNDVTAVSLPTAEFKVLDEMMMMTSREKDRGRELHGKVKTNTYKTRLSHATHLTSRWNSAIKLRWPRVQWYFFKRDVRFIARGNHVCTRVAKIVADCFRTDILNITRLLELRQ